jgi:hypothetical protein
VLSLCWWTFTEQNLYKRCHLCQVPDGAGADPARFGDAPAASVGGVEEALRVLRRLDRIEAMDRGGAQPRALLDELRALVAEAELWARRERIEEPDELRRCREALALAGRAPTGR